MCLQAHAEAFSRQLFENAWALFDDLYALKTHGNKGVSQSATSAFIAFLHQVTYERSLSHTSLEYIYICLKDTQPEGRNFCSSSFNCRPHDMTIGSRAAVIGQQGVGLLHCPLMCLMSVSEAVGGWAHSTSILNLPFVSIDFRICSGFTRVGCTLLESCHRSTVCKFCGSALM